MPPPTPDSAKLETLGPRVTESMAVHASYGAVSAMSSVSPSGGMRGP